MTLTLFLHITKPFWNEISRYFKTQQGFKAHVAHFAQSQEAARCHRPTVWTPCTWVGRLETFFRTTLASNCLIHCLPGKKAKLWHASKESRISILWYIYIYNKKNRVITRKQDIILRTWTRHRQNRHHSTTGPWQHDVQDKRMCPAQGQHWKSWSWDLLVVHVHSNYYNAAMVSMYIKAEKCICQVSDSHAGSKKRLMSSLRGQKAFPRHYWQMMRYTWLHTIQQNETGVQVLVKLLSHVKALCTNELKT